MMTQAKPVILVDGSSYLYRAYNALPPLSTSDGYPTGALFGVANMLRKLLDSYQPDHIGVVFDARGKTFRDELYADYKAHRPPMPEDLAQQVEPLHALVQALGLPLLQVQGVEADDVIGTLARKLAEQGQQVIIVTGDKDMAQLVDERISLLDTMKDRVSDIQGIQDKFGVAPGQIVDYLTLMGDSSDNIPGVPGVGGKTAAKWLQQYGSLDAIIERADEIKGKVGERLRAALEQLPLYRKLVTIRCDVPDLDPAALRRGTADRAVLRELYSRYEFNSWLSQLDQDEAATATPQTVPEQRYTMVDSLQALDEWLVRLQKAELFAFDTETTSLNYMEAEIVGVSFAVEAGEAAYVPLAHDYPGAPDQLDRAEVLEKLRPLLEDMQLAKLGQHLKYDRHVLANHGIELHGIRHDTMLASYVLDSTSRHDMDSLAEKYLARKTIHFEDIAGKGAKQLHFNEIPLEQAVPYAAEDADVTLQLHQVLWPRLCEHTRLREVYETIEMPLLEVLYRMEHLGVQIDVERLRAQSQQIGKRLLELEQEAEELAGQPFNLGSPKQLQSILFDKLGLPARKKTPKGQPSTAEDALAELSDYPLPRLILEHRGLAKLKSTYTDKLPLMVNAATGRVHTSYHQAVASTGRLSSADPNLQNIPVRTVEGRRIRQAFVAPPGYRILAADYSQIELRIMAHLSGDRGLLDAFASSADIHRATAAEVFELEPNAVSAEQRRSAKAINFGLIYGMSAFGLARQLGIERSAAQEYVERYFTRYPGVKAFMDNIRKQAAQQGYVETVYGRRLYLPSIKDKNVQRRQAAERTAINAPMQGTAADIIKKAMIEVQARLAQSDLAVRMVMQVHDELVFEIGENEADAAQELIRDSMMRVAELQVPLEVDIGIGENWDEAH